MSPRSERILRDAANGLRARYDEAVRRTRDCPLDDYDQVLFDRLVAAADAAYDSEVDRIREWADERKKAKETA